MPETPIFQKTEKLETSGGVQSFGQAARQSAADTNILSSMGSNLAIGAATKRAELSGIELGKTPQGDVLPAITQSDKAFEAAYRNQAQATLSLQGQDLMNKSLFSLQEAGPLTAGGIQEFNASMSKGFEDIAKNSPTADQANLMNSFNNSLMETSQKLQTNLLKQTQAQAADTRNGSLSNSSTNMFESIVNGNMQGAEEARNDAVTSVVEMFNAGQISGSQRDTKLQEIKLSFITGEEYSGYLDAKSEGKGAKYLSDFGKSKRDDMTTVEQMQVGQKILALIKNDQATDNMHQANLNSESKAKVDAGAVTAADTARYEKEMTKEGFDTFMISMDKATAKSIKKIDKVNAVLENYNSSQTPNFASKEDINAAYNATTQAVQQNNPEMTDAMARGVAANNAAFPIPEHLDFINGLATSSVGADIEVAGNLIRSLEQTKASNLDGLSKTSRGMTMAYDKLRRKGLSPEASAAEADKAIFGVTETESNARGLKWKSENDRVFGSPNKGTTDVRIDNIISGAREFMGLGKKERVTNEVDYSLAVQASYKENYDMFGDFDTAKEMTRKEFEEASRRSTYNNAPGDNNPTITMGAVEMVYDLTPGTEYYVKDEAAEQLKPFIDRYNKQATLEGGSTWEMDYRGIVMFPEFQVASARLAEAKKEIDQPQTREQKAFLRKEIRELEGTVDLFHNPEKGEPVIRQKFSDGTVGQDLTIGLNSKGKDKTFNGAQQMTFIGITKNGGNIPLQNLYTEGNEQATFIADTNKYNKQIETEMGQTGSINGRSVINELNKTKESFSNQQAQEKQVGAQAIQKRQKEFDRIKVREEIIDNRADLTDAQKDTEKDRQLAMDISRKYLDAFAETGTALSRNTFEAFVAIPEVAGRIGDIPINAVAAAAPAFQNLWSTIKDIASLAAGTTPAELAARNQGVTEPQPTGEFLESTGKEIIDNGDGTVSTEKSITVEDMNLNGGKPTNIPTIWNGTQMTDEASIDMAIESTEKYPSFESIPAAEKAAIARSEKLDEEIKAQEAAKEADEAETIEDIKSLDSTKSGGVLGLISSAAQAVGGVAEDLKIIAQIESNLNPGAKAKTSSATGLFQFTNAGFKDAVRRFGNKNGITSSDRNDTEKNIILAAEVTEANRQELKRVLGREPETRDVYLAHFAGLSGAKKALIAFDKNPNSPVSAGFSTKAIKANKSLLKGTLADVMARLDQKIATAKKATN